MARFCLNQVCSKYRKPRIDDHASSVGGSLGVRIPEISFFFLEVRAKGIEGNKEIADDFFFFFYP